MMSLQNRRGRVHGAQSHLRRVEARPLAVDDGAQHRQPVFRHRFLRCQHHPRCAVGDLRTVAGGNVAEFGVEERSQLGEVRRSRIFAHTVVGGVELAVAVVKRSDLAVESPRLLRGKDSGVALGGELVHLDAADAESVCEILRSLPHQQADHWDRSDPS